MSNHEMAKRYINKQRLIGREILDLRLLENDKVELVGVKDKDDTGRLVVPSFVTDIKMYLANGVFNGCKYSEIYIDNKEDMELSCKYLCAGMKCEKLIVRFRHSKNIKDMSYMFGECNNLKELNISGINLSSVKSIEGMFSGCSHINTIDIRDIDMSKVQNMQYLFEGCRGLNEVKNISDIDVRSVKDMSHMFEHCASLKDIDISKWDICEVEDMSQMFLGCSMLKNIKLCEIDKSKVVTNNMFMWCYANVYSISINSTK